MQGPKWLVLLIIIVYETLCGHWCCLGQVLYLGRAPRTNDTLPDFRERCRVNRHSRVFRGLTGCQRTPWFWGVTQIVSSHVLFNFVILLFFQIFRNMSTSALCYSILNYFLIHVSRDANNFSVLNYFVLLANL